MSTASPDQKGALSLSAGVLLLPWVLCWLTEVPVLSGWGFGGVAMLFPLVLYLLVGLLLQVGIAAACWCVRRATLSHRLGYWSHWTVAGSMALGLLTHTILFQNQIEVPQYGIVSILMGGLGGLACGGGFVRVLGRFPAWQSVAAVCGLVLLLSIGTNQWQRQQWRPSQRTNVLLVTIDTCQARRLSPYGYELDTTPCLKQLSEEGRRFDRAYTPIALTGPAHASLFTGRHPLELQLTDNLRPLSPRFQTLAEVLRGAGYRTLGVPGNMMVRSRQHLHQGFDRYPQAAGAQDLRSLQWEHSLPWRAGRLLLDRQWTLSRFVPDARIQTDTALSLIKPGGPAPWFCWVHYFDAHSPYVATTDHLLEPVSTPQDLLQELCSHHGLYDLSYGPMADLFGEEVMEERGITPLVAAPSELEDVRRMYDAQLRYIDQQLERLLTTLRTQGMLDNTIVIVTADHGEMLFEQGYFGHSYFPWEEELHIPMIWWWPDKIAPGVSSDLVMLQEIGPSVLSCLGIDAASAAFPDEPTMLAQVLLRKAGESSQQSSPQLAIRGDHSRTLLLPDGEKLTWFARRDSATHAWHPWTGPVWRLERSTSETEMESIEEADAMAYPSFPTWAAQLDAAVRELEGVSLPDVNFRGYAKGPQDASARAMLQSLGYLQGQQDVPAGRQTPPPPRYTPAAAALRDTPEPADRTVE